MSKSETAGLSVGRIDLGPTEPRHLTQREQRVMDAALRKSHKVLPDPEVERLKSLLRRFHMADNQNASQIARLQDEAATLLGDGL